jgi:hypothetical protein
MRLTLETTIDYKPLNNKSMLTKRMNDLERQADAIEEAAVNKQIKETIDVNTLMNMNDMYYVGNLVDVDGSGWVTKAEAQAILNEIS